MIQLTTGYTHPDVPKKESHLPGSTHGSPHHMATLAKNALVLVSDWGCPCVFLTLTCNPKWPEIQSQLLNGQTAFKRPDETAPVFKSRLDVMKTNIRNGKYFGGQEIMHTFHVIEYQYCRLPHTHVAICLKDAYDIDEDNCDDLVSFVNQHFLAEMPC